MRRTAAGINARSKQNCTQWQPLQRDTRYFVLKNDANSRLPLFCWTFIYKELCTFLRLALKRILRNVRELRSIQRRTEVGDAAAISTSCNLCRLIRRADPDIPSLSEVTRQCNDFKKDRPEV